MVTRYQWLILLIQTLAWAQTTPSEDSMTRTMDYQDRATEATTLFNEGKYEEALAVFRRLAASSPDLDKGGYVALTIGDCLAALGRRDEAQAAYQQARASRPELADSVADKLTELDLATNVTDALIGELRSAAYTSGEVQWAAYWKLARALQSRALSLLKEAGAAFRTGAEVTTERTYPPVEAVRRYVTTLDEVAEDLKALVEQAESNWWSPRSLGLGKPCLTLEPGAEAKESQARGSVRTMPTQDGHSAEVKIAYDPQGDEVRVVVNGQPLELPRGQQLLIRRHEERINAILRESMKQSQR